MGGTVDRYFAEKKGGHSRFADVLYEKLGDMGLIWKGEIKNNKF